MKQYLAFDWGKRRIGVASGNDFLKTATGVATLSADAQQQWISIDKLIKEWRPAALVVGVPYHPDGAAHQNTKAAKAFADALGERSGLAIHLVDERYSTTEAKRNLGMTDNLRSAKRAEKLESTLDSQAACVILEQFLQHTP